MKPRITLCIILGNEEAVIGRCLKYFLPAVDSVSAVRAVGTATPDKTEEILRAACEKMGKPLHFAEYKNGLLSGHDVYTGLAPVVGIDGKDPRTWPHIDHFGAARQLAWTNAEVFNPTHLLWCDADDILSEGSVEHIRECAEGEQDCMAWPYKTPKETPIRERLVKVGISRWSFAIHEQLIFTAEKVERLVSKEAVWIHEPLENKVPNHERNLRILEYHLRYIGRDLFYLSQQHHARKDVRRFNTIAKAAIACEPDPVEAYDLYLNLAQNETDIVKAQEYALKAFQAIPERREALAFLTSACIALNQYQRAYNFAQLMMRIPVPSLSYWNIQHAWYDWKGMLLYTQCLRLVGKNVEATDFENEIFHKNGGTFSIIHATLGREKQALAMREIWLNRADNPLAVEYIFGLHEFDNNSRTFLAGIKHSLTQKKGAGPNLESAAALSTGKILVQAQDDIVPPRHWDTLLLQKIGDRIDKPCFVTVSDGHRTDQIHVTSVMTRAYMDQKGRGDCEGCGFGHPGYFSMYWDTENSYRAYQDGENGNVNLIDGRDLVFFHDHPIFQGKKIEEMDKTYQIENAPEHYSEGRALFDKRNPEAKAKGW
jgi:hypothetical protein